MNEQDISIVARHFAIWSERDAAKRAAMMPEVYASDIEIIDPHFVAHGQENLQELIANLQAKFPDRRFRLRKPIEGHHNVGRLFWQLGTEDLPAMETGMDVFTLENGKISRLLIFIDAR